MNEEKVTLVEQEEKSFVGIKKTTSSKIFLIYIIALCALAAVYLWKGIVDVFSFGSISVGSKIFLNPTCVSAYVYTRTGYIIVGLIGIAMCAIFVLAAVQSILFKTSDKVHPGDRIYKLTFAHKLLFGISILKLIDSCILSLGLFYTTIQAKPAEFLKNVFDFYRITELYEMFGIAKLAAALPNLFVNLLVVVLINTVIMAFGLFQLIMFKKIIDSFNAIAETVISGVVREKKKTPFVLPIIFTSAYGVLSIFLFINGSFIMAIANVVLAAYVMLTALFLKNINSNIQEYGAT